MKKTDKKKISADEIAEMAMNGDDVSMYFSNKGEMRPSVHRVNVDFTLSMVNELDQLLLKQEVTGLIHGSTISSR